MNRRLTRQYISSGMTDEMVQSMMDLIPTPTTTPAQTPVEEFTDESSDDNGNDDDYGSDDEITMETRAMIDNAMIEMVAGETSTAFITGKSICVYLFRVCFMYDSCVF